MTLGTIPYLFLTTVLELLALPFHLAMFAIRRERIRAHVLQLLRAQRSTGRST